MIIRPCLWETVDWLSSIEVRPEAGRALASEPMTRVGLSWDDESLPASLVERVGPTSSSCCATSEKARAAAAVCYGC